MAGKVDFYVYRIFDGPTTVYVGKGSGVRLTAQKSRFGLPGEIIEECRSDDHAFEREQVWIAALQPTDNRSLGGGGGRAVPRKGKRQPRYRPDALDIMLAVYGKKYAIANILLRFLDESNCEQYGVPRKNISIFRQFVAQARPINASP